MRKHLTNYFMNHKHGPNGLELYRIWHFNAKVQFKMIILIKSDFIKTS